MKTHDDIDTNPSTAPHIADLIRTRLESPARRGLLRGAAGLGALSFIGGGAGLLSGCAAANERPYELGFDAVPKSLADAVAVPDGYTAKVLFRLGDPMNATTGAYANDGSDAAASFEWRAGDHHDGMYFFGMSPSGKWTSGAARRGLLAINHEAITPSFLHPSGVTTNGQSGAAQARTVPDEVLREFYVHGVSVIEVAQDGRGNWSYVQGSPFNRRVHTLTDMVVSGPAAGTPYMVTKHSPTGTRTRGTVNNCASGPTPWGTYLTCEENWAGYFRRIASTDDPLRTAKEKRALARYGVTGNGRELWATVAPDTADNLYGRWNAMVLAADATQDYRNVANTFGWNVEIDPFDPAATPKKRTAMGRFAHEGAWHARPVAGRPLVFYMGCDSRNEYIYKFVSTRPWNPSDEGKGMAAGDKYLDDGKLYVARFDADGTGRWIELSLASVQAINPGFDYPFADDADVAIHSRLAADAVGATRMDRPEWGAVDPITGAVYMTLTNTNEASRPLASLDAANPRHYNGRPAGAAQWGNPNGHIIRWLEPNGDPSATTFKWDVYLFAARASADPKTVNLSKLDDSNDLSSPDGLWFSERGVCWIQTDDGAYTDTTNCMLLASLPGSVGDGGPVPIENTDRNGQKRSVQTYLGKPPGDRLRRFLVGPVQCEITGITESPDGKALFVNIQHPGEETPPASIGNPAGYTSHWPDGGLSRPRSATLVITKDDGGVIGL